MFVRHLSTKCSRTPRSIVLKVPLSCMGGGQFKYMCIPVAEGAGRPELAISPSDPPVWAQRGHGMINNLNNYGSKAVWSWRTELAPACVRVSPIGLSYAMVSPPPTPPSCVSFHISQVTFKEGHPQGTRSHSRRLLACCKPCSPFGSALVPEIPP
jgi:hypothetical protein